MKGLHPIEPPLSEPVPRLKGIAASGLSLLVVAAGACTRGPAYGSDNALIAVVSPEVRATVEPLIRQVFEREVFTTRGEPIFEVTFTSPAELGSFRNWRRLVVIEPTADPALLPDIVDVPDSGPLVEVVRDEWARDQTIWVLAAETPEATVELVRARIDSLYAAVHHQFLEHHLARMWASGADSVRAAALRDSFGFSIMLPRVYHPAQASAPPDSRVWYNEDPRRVVSMHWRPAPDRLSAEAVLAARREWGRSVFPADSIVGSLEGSRAASADPAAATPPDTAAAPSDTTGRPPAPAVRAERATLDGRPAVRLQGVWRSTDGVNAGLFLTYGVLCGERLVLLDGNLYAPDRNKYPYVFQLERIFGTFRCASTDGPRPSVA